MSILAPVSPAELLLRRARSDLWVREHPRASNRGEVVEHMLARVALSPGQPWCAAAVSTWGSDAFGRDWPLPLTGGCAYLAERADSKGMLREQPVPGAIFLLHFASLGRFAHTGILDAAADVSHYYTIEGNTSDPAHPG